MTKKLEELLNLPESQDIVKEEEKKDKEVDRAMNLFEQVQAKKKERMKILHDQENERLGVQDRSSERMVDTLLKIIESTDDDRVRLEAIKQLSSLRQSDVEGTKVSKE